MSARRQIERVIAGIMRNDGDRCSLCHAAFTNSAATYGGICHDEGPALVGNCCMEKLQLIVTAGIYLTPHAYSQECAAEVARKAGLNTPVVMGSATTPWSCDDRQWFAANPQRSHRLRPAFPGELDALRGSNPSCELQAPPDHEIQFVVRQVEPGKRIRLPLCRDIACPIPDIEPILHAIFDIYSKGGPAGTPVSVAEVKELALKYAAATRAHS
jgi:hypothetical protein